MGTDAAREHHWWQRGGGWHRAELARAEAAHARIRALGQSSACQDGRAQLSSCPLGLCPPGRAPAGLAPAVLAISSSPAACRRCHHPAGDNTFPPTPPRAGGCPQHPCLPCPATGPVPDLGTAIPPCPLPLSHLEAIKIIECFKYSALGLNIHQQSYSDC